MAKHIVILTDAQIREARRALDYHLHLFEDGDGLKDGSPEKRAMAAALAAVAASTPHAGILVSLTPAEAKALSHAAGNSTDHPDAMEALFPTDAERKSAYRAHQKLADAQRNAGA